MTWVVEPRKPTGNPDSWLITLADLLALLVTFFVLIFSMNAVQHEEWQSIVESLTDNFNPERAAIAETDEQNPDASRVDDPPGQTINYLSAVLRSRLAQDELLEEATFLDVQSDRMILSISTNKIFEEGSLELSTEGRRSIATIVDLLAPVDNHISIGAHVSVAPVESEIFSDHWGISLGRAGILAAVLRSAGYRQDIRAFGYGTSRFKDLDEDILLETRYTLSDRLDIIVSERANEGVRF